jgi:hypothetical protein
LTGRCFGVVDNHLKPKGVFAFAIDLEREAAKMQLEDRQVIGRCLDNSLQPGWFVATMTKGAVFGAKDGFDAFEGERRTQTVNQALKELLPSDHL